MAKFARKAEDRWIDVHIVPSEFFADLPDLEKKLGVTGFIKVDDAVKPGDIVVGDNGYEPAPVPKPEVPTGGRDLTWDEFLDVGMTVDATKINTVLAKMPVVAEFGRKYVSVAGIQYADASNPGKRLNKLLAAAVAAGLITNQTVTDFLARWQLDYPAK